MKTKFVILFILICLGCSNLAVSQDLQNCKAWLHNDTLTIENNVIFQHFLWNNGNLIRLAFGDRKSGQSILESDDLPSFNAGKKGTITTGKGTLQVTNQPATSITPEYVKVSIKCSINKLQVLRVFRLYPECPAIACELYLKGRMEGKMVSSFNSGDSKNIQNGVAGRQDEPQVTVTDKVRLQGNHWKARSVEFFDVSDHNNTFVQTYDRLLYLQECQLRGNLLLLENVLSGKRLFILKEAPTSSVQLHYSGYDFIAKSDEVKVTGLGLVESDLSDTAWTKAYGTIIGLSLTNDELGILSSLRNYQQSVRRHLPGRDDMILMNTWGDGGRDTKVSEVFCIAELESAAKLGISHFQLDDGWQTGRSSNSAFQGGSLDNIWRNPNYWKPNHQKFPNGLAPLVKRGKELGIEICLWFNPSSDNGNLNWEKDADALITLYKENGIRTFKIDGVKMPDKISEINFRSMLDKVVKATDGNAVFNLDVTASLRGGYNFFNEYGNIFLENRYTDRQSYYPYWTLRNLWMLSRYIPTQSLQIEFLNIWRNQAKYAGDPFGPVNYPFDYVFAITMIAQPLAWFEATGLPPEAFQSAPAIKKYKSLQNEIHSGTILPIGNEPDGIQWTGFQSIIGNKGFLLVFREASPIAKASIKTWLAPGTRVKCESVIGAGNSFTAQVDTDNVLPFELKTINTYALYKYEVIK